MTRLFSLSRLAALFAFGAVLLVGMVAGFLYLTDHAGPATQDQVIWVKPGSSLGSIARDLERDGLIKSAGLFKLAGRVEGGHVRAGEFVVPAYSSINDILGLLKNGAVYQRQITIPEGWTSREIVARIAAADYLVGAVPDPNTIREGSLMPETYGYDRGTDRAALIARMAAAQSAALDAAWEARTPHPGIKTKQDVLVLASIVEKEAGHDAERGRIARAFLNRLELGMKLEADPTVIHAVELKTGKPLERPLSRKDLRTPSPYNTYYSAGLPPSPICHPGLASIKAVLNAPPGDDLFFVADGTGGHVFAKTLAGHNKNVAAWRRYQRAQKQKTTGQK